MTEEKKDEQSIEPIQYIENKEKAEIEISEENKPHSNVYKEILSYVILIVVAFVLANVIHNYVFTPTFVDGTSMMSKIHDKDYVLTWRLGKLDRFDIVVLLVPQDNNEYYIKRLVGLPGDTVEFINHQLYINGQLTDEPYLDPTYTSGDYYTPSLTKICSETNGGEGVNCNNNGDMVIPEGYYLVLGDNRMNSEDSRYIGLIPASHIEGKAIFILYPFNRIGKL